MDLDLFTEFEEWVQWKSSFGLDRMLAESGGNCMTWYLNNFNYRARGTQQAKAVIDKEVAVTRITWNWGCEVIVVCIVFLILSVSTYFVVILFLSCSILITEWPFLVSLSFLLCVRACAHTHTHIRRNFLLF